MDINSILKGVECSCGKKHKCDIEYVYIESGAVKRLKELCKNYKSVMVVADKNTYAAAGDMVENCICQKISQKVIFDGKTVLIPDEKAIEKVQKHIENKDLILAIGSGVIQDLCKYVSFFSKIPYMVVATAPSMDGYASSGAAMILKGMKETVSAGLPRAIIADVDVLKNAPIEMIKAGYGDIIGKYSALCDWTLSQIVNGEYFCKYIYDTVYSMIEKTKSTAAGLLKRDEESIKALTEALMVVGIMMSFAGSSRPASGSEHHLSHFFEITGILNNEPYFVHGLDVAYSTVITAKLREKILKSDFPNKVYRLSRDMYVQKMNEIYKSASHGCIALQDKTGNYSQDCLYIYRQKKNEILDSLSDMPSSLEIQNMLSLAEIDMKDFYNMYSSEKIENAVMYAKDLKDRYTVLWLYYDLLGKSENKMS